VHRSPKSDRLLGVKPTVYPNAGGPLKNLTRIALYARIMTVLTVNPSLGVKPVRQLIDLAKSRPGSSTPPCLASAARCT
jgi:hypothetical protein